jgi:arylsulfatase A-like enzyme
VFEHAYSHAPLTLPAHASLFSGRLPFDTGVRDEVASAFKPGERLLTEMLHDRGFATGGVVSAPILGKGTGLEKGFDFYDDEMPVLSADTTDEPQRDGVESEAVAERWLGRAKSSRLFLFLHLNEPHAPYLPPKRFSNFLPYDGEIAYADEIVGRLIRHLKTHQLYDQSTIVLASDHGEGLGAHGEQEHGLFVYDEAIRVPLVVKQAGGVGAGRRVADLVQLIDIVPTILDLVKAPVPGNLRGRSLRPLLDGTGRIPAASVYSEAVWGHRRFGWSELTSLTTQEFRYIKAPREELYSRLDDPQEYTNLVDAAGRSEKAKNTLRVALDALVGKAAAATSEGAVDPKDRWAIAEVYQHALRLDAERKWTRSIALLKQVLRDEPQAREVWNRLAVVAMNVNRYDLAIDAYRHVIDLDPSDAWGCLGAATALVKAHKLDEARDQAERAVELAMMDRRALAAAHTALAQIALARHDEEAARLEAALVREADPSTPMPPYVEARLLYEQGKYADAVPLFEEAIAALRGSRSGPIPDLRYYSGEALRRVERYSDSEYEFLAEIREFPHNVRARASLAVLYDSQWRIDEAAATVTELVKTTPSPEAYAAAIRLWTTLGDRRKADALRAEARREFGQIDRKS